MKKFILHILLLILAFGSCKPVVQQQTTDPAILGKKKEKALININNYLARRNQELLQQFVKRTELQGRETGSGLWYGIYEKGTGNAVASGDLVEFTFYLSLLDGTPIDSTTIEQPKSFRSGKGGLEAGLEEGVLLLHEGDRVRFIIPPHLAYGNFGNDEKIPPGAFLFYDLHLIAVNP